MMLEDALNLLEESEPAMSSPNKSPSKELSGTLRNLKKLEHVFNGTVSVTYYLIFSLTYVFFCSVG